MNKITCRINTNTKIIKYVTPETDIKINEYENRGTSITFLFDYPINETDQLFIVFLNSKKEAFTYQLSRQANNKYFLEIPREILSRGRLYYTIQHYNGDLTNLRKYAPDGYLYINPVLDVSIETLEHRPDLIAELIYEIQQLKQRIDVLESK